MRWEDELGDGLGGCWTWLLDETSVSAMEVSIG